MRFSIVGMRHHPPAAALVSVLGLNTLLSLRPDPFNPFDPNAKQVWVQTESLSDATRRAFEGLDSTTDLASQPEWMLGYIAATFASQEPLVSLHDEVVGSFDLNDRGQPRFRLARD